MLRQIILLFFIFLFQSGYSQFVDDCRIDQFIVQLESSNSARNLEFPGLKSSRCIHSGAGVYLLEFDPSDDRPEFLLNQLNEHSEIIHAMKNCKMSIRSTPNDSLFFDQWSLERTEATKFWDIGQGKVTPQGDSIVVAIIDNGYDLDQEDLKNNFWKNEGEIPNDEIDNDGNGYVDDYVGLNVLKGNDDHEFWAHGTNVAGIIGATGDNEIGVTGMTWGAQLMLISKAATMDRAIEGLYYTYEQRKLYNETDGAEGAFVVAVNYSQGFDFQKCEKFPLWDQAFDSLGQVGILSVGATVNANRDIDIVGDIPSSCSSDFLVTVTHTTQTDRIDSKAGYGKTTIDLGAPGSQNLTSFPNDKYDYFTGTSSSTPHVAGAIALLYSSPCSDFQAEIKSNPRNAALTLKRSLLAGTDPLASLEGVSVSGGRLNVWRAFQELSMTYGQNDATFGVVNLFPNPSEGLFEVEILLPEQGFYVFEIFDSAGRKMLQDEIAGFCLEENYEMDLTSYKSGYYVLKITYDEETIIKPIIIL